MTLKDELGLLYRDMLKQKLWFDRLSKKEMDDKEKAFLQGESYTRNYIAAKIRRMVSDHYRNGKNDVKEWDEEAKAMFESYVKNE